MYYHSIKRFIKIKIRYLMLPRHVPLPHVYKPLDFIAKQAVKWGVPIAQLNSDSLHQAAIRKTGLDDFGDPYYQTGLVELMDSVNQDADMHTYGKFVFRIMLVNYLSQRLYFVEAQKKQPSAFQSALNPPLIVTGLPRSGTTLMHRLLSMHPNLIGIPFWKLFRPFSAPRGLDFRQWQAHCELNLLRPALPGMGVKHKLCASQAEEDLWLTGLTFHSPVFWILAPVAGYAEWFLRVDRTKAYGEYALLLHWFQSHVPKKTLVMKAPDHMPDLDKLLTVVPNARVLQLHRNPETCALSLSSLLYSTHRLFTSDLHPRRIYEINRLLIEYYQEENLRVRCGLNVQQAIVDVDYKEVTANPAGTIRKISADTGFEWLGQDEVFLKAIRKSSKSRKKPFHHYSAEQFRVIE